MVPLASPAEAGATSAHAIRAPTIIAKRLSTALSFRVDRRRSATGRGQSTTLSMRDGDPHAGVRQEIELLEDREPERAASYQQSQRAVRIGREGQGGRADCDDGYECIHPDVARRGHLPP